MEATLARLRSVPGSETDLLWLGLAIPDWTGQTKATEAFWGSSGRGNPRAVARLNLYANVGLLERRRVGRSTQFRATQELRTWAESQPGSNAVREIIAPSLLA